MRRVTVLLSVLAAIALPTAAGTPAQAACPTNDSAYNHDRGGSIPAGTAEIHWRIDNITDGPCSKNELIDTSGTQANCMEITFDWTTNDGGHYDSRNFVTCHQSFWKQRVISEPEADEAIDLPFGDSALHIDGIDWMFICGRNNDQPGQELGPRVNCDRQYGSVNWPQSQPHATDYSEYWIWYANDTFQHFD
jgi:hypothetical protein